MIGEARTSAELRGISISSGLPNKFKFAIDQIALVLAPRQPIITVDTLVPRISLNFDG